VTNIVTVGVLSMPPTDILYGSA